MADRRFFALAGPFTVADIAHRIGAELAGTAQADRVLRNVAPLETATPDDLSFLDNRHYLEAFRTTRAGAVIVNPKLAAEAPPDATLLVTAQPYRAYALAAQAFYPEAAPVADTAKSAVIDPSAQLGEGCRIEANAVIGADARIGRGCSIGANAVIGAAVVLGDDVRIGANASLSHCLVGSRVRIYPGARIGQDGFGFAPDPNAPVKVPQLGLVIIGDDVEIGANACIDRGAGPDTVIGAGTMIDNLVQIGHNVHVGRHCVIIGQVGIAGSCELGDFVVLAGQVGLGDHAKVGSGARLASRAGTAPGVNLPGGRDYGGAPAKPVREWMREIYTLEKLAKAPKKTENG
jgi:UDP-3-O-[3-hydroxymyristoyl] glucosamine N-acyltransferase